MKLMFLVLLLSGIQGLVTCNNDTENPVDNVNGTNKDMYVIHAMVYQVGIISNKTDEEIANGTIGNQEAVTFFHNNGTGLDLSSIPALSTNVTTQDMVGVAPVSSSGSLSWSALQNITGLQSIPSKTTESHSQKTDRIERDLRVKEDSTKSNGAGNETLVKLTKGTAVIPVGAGINYLSIPPLMGLNKNFSEIPVPIPNTSVVHYAKINTLVNMP